MLFVNGSNLVRSGQVHLLCPHKHQVSYKLLEMKMNISVLFVLMLWLTQSTARGLESDKEYPILAQMFAPSTDRRLELFILQEEGDHIEETLPTISLLSGTSLCAEFDPAIDILNEDPDELNIAMLSGSDEITSEASIVPTMSPHTPSASLYEQTSVKEDNQKLEEETVSSPILGAPEITTSEVVSIEEVVVPAPVAARESQASSGSETIPVTSIQLKGKPEKGKKLIRGLRGYDSKGLK